MIEDKALSGPLEERYAGWKSAEGQGDACRQADAGGDRRARRQEEDRAAAEIRPAGICWRTSSTATSDAAPIGIPDPPARTLAQAKGFACAAPQSPRSCLQTAVTNLVYSGSWRRHERRRRTDMQHEREIDALLSLWRDRIDHRPADGAAASERWRGGSERMGPRRRQPLRGPSREADALADRCDGDERSRNASLTCLRSPTIIPADHDRRLPESSVKTPARTRRPTRSRCARRCRPWRPACRPPAGAPR